MAVENKHFQRDIFAMIPEIERVLTENVRLLKNAGWDPSPWNRAPEARLLRRCEALIKKLHS